MADILRQLLYPLVVPAIVACVWLHAWGMRQVPDFVTVTAEPPAAATMGSGASNEALPPPAAYGFSAADGLASAGPDEE